MGPRLASAVYVAGIDVRIHIAVCDDRGDVVAPVIVVVERVQLRSVVAAVRIQDDRAPRRGVQQNVDEPGTGD